jgi:branched-chain amino acid transport system substrate-binding protein
MKAAQPDLFMAASYTPDAILLLRQAKELNFNVKVWQGLGGGWGTPDTYKALGKDLNYILNTEYAPVHINKNAVPGADEFHKRYQQKYKEPVLYPVPQTAYMGTLALFDIIKRAGSLEHEAIAKAAWETDIPLWTTPSGWGVKFFGPGKPHPGQNSRSFMYLTQWKDGSQHVLWPKSAQYSNPVIPLPTWQERDKK